MHVFEAFVHPFMDVSAHFIGELPALSREHRNKGCKAYLGAIVPTGGCTTDTANATLPRDCPIRLCKEIVPATLTGGWQDGRDRLVVCPAGLEGCSATPPANSQLMCS